MVAEFSWCQFNPVRGFSFVFLYLTKPLLLFREASVMEVYLSRRDMSFREASVMEVYLSRKDMS